jgi:hypothetical protein
MCKRLIFLTSFVLVLSLVCNAGAQGTGSIMREVWEGIGGTNVADLTGNANYPDNPTWGSLVTLLEQPEEDLGSDFGSRIHGFLHPATSGDYTFWIAADDGCELLLSTDDDPANAVSIAGHNSWTGSRQFDSMPEQMSEPVALEAGGKYYISATYKEGGGGDNVAVAWEGPDCPARDVIDGSFLSPAPWNIVLLKAKDPNPADGTVDADTASLEWVAGASAVSHKVYLSTDAAIEESELVAETDLTIHLTALDTGAAYYWRVDEVDADGAVIEGAVWSFTTLPLEAHFPSPADGGTNAVSALLSWTPGKGAIMHNVHFGTDPAALLPVQMMSMETSYDPGALEIDTAYYWRVDEFAGAATNAGPVWSFSTAPLVPSPEIPDLEAWYSLDQDASSIGVLDMSGNNRHGSIYGDPLWGDGYDGGALDFGGAGDFVEMTGYAGVTGTGSRTLTAWINTAAIGEVASWGLNVAGQKWIFRVQESNGTVGAIRVEVNGGYQVGSVDVRDGQWHHVAAVLADDGSPNVTEIALYVDGSPEVISAQLDEPIDTAPSGNVRIGQSPWGNRPFTGLIDDVRIYSRTLETAEIRVLAGVEELPYSPAPADGEVDLEAAAVALTWNPAQDAVEQDVYLGIDEAAVATADASDATGIYLGRQAETELALADLGRGVRYFWRVDGVKADGTVMPGTVWNFRIIDRNTDNWAAGVGSADPGYLDTYVQDGLYDIGTFGGEMTYEFIVQSNPDETEASMALIGRRQFGDTQVGIKYEQWNNTGTYGATVFGVVDLDFGIPTAPGEHTHLVFVSSEAAGMTELYVNGALEGSVASAITLSGLVGIGYGAQGEDMAGSFDNFDGSIFGVAIYDRILTADEIAGNADKYFSPIPITDPDLLIYYDFESGEGSTALDQSGHSNHGQFMGNPEWASGLFGGAVSVDIADLDYIQTTAPLGIVSNTVSVTGWVKLEELPAGWSGILTHRGTSPGCLGLQHDGSELRYMWGADQYWSFSSGLALPVGEWYFAALTISPDQGKLYLNGLEQTATNVAPHEPTNFDSLIRVGRDHQDGRIMTSLIDEVRFYNKTLTDVEILRLAQPQLADVTAPGDNIQGVPNDGDWPGGETPDLATDDDIGTKYLHFKGETEPTGFQIEPASGASIVTGLTLTTANDAIERDPISYELSGSNESIDGPYTLIASGDIVDFAQETALPRFTMNATAISFDNDVAYKYYQVMFPAVRDPGSANSMQIAEVELLGLPAPVGHWAFDDGAGDVALDSSGNNNDGTVTLATWVEGMDGSALDMAGVGYVDVPAESWSSIENEMTVAFWAYGDPAVMPQSHTVFAAYSDPENNEARIASAHIPWSNGTVYFDTGGTPTSGGYDRINKAASAEEYAGQWRHWAFLKNAETGDQQIYLDGALWHSGTGLTRPMAGVTAFTIGARNDGEQVYPGIVDDFRLYGQALSAMQIYRLANP